MCNAPVTVNTSVLDGSQAKTADWRPAERGSERARLAARYTRPPLIRDNGRRRAITTTVLR